MRIELAQTNEEIIECHAVMRHLRDVDASTFLERVRSQEKAGYRLAFLRLNGSPVAVAGFRVSENLAWGRHLYVDDLVTLAEARSRGHGAALLSWLDRLAKQEGCEQIHLDSGTEREDAHRFYVRKGFNVSSLHFKKIL